MRDIDAIMTEILQLESFAKADQNALYAADTRLHGLIASVGLRRNLFPDADAYLAIKHLPVEPA